MEIACKEIHMEDRFRLKEKLTYTELVIKMQAHSVVRDGA